MQENIEIFNSREIFNEASIFLAAGTVSACALAGVGSIPLAVCGTLGTALVMHLKSKRESKISDISAIESAFHEKKSTEQEAIFSNRFGRSLEDQFDIDHLITSISRMSKILKLKEVPNLFCIDEHSETFSKEARDTNKRFPLIRNTINAVAVSTNKSSVGVTEKLIDHLNSSELEGVIGHEMGHIAAKHGKLSNIVSSLMAPAAIATGANFLLNLGSSWTNAGLFVGTMAASIAVGVGKVMLSNKSEQNYSDLKKSASATTIILAKVSFAGCAAAFGGPGLLASYALVESVSLASKLLTGHQSRMHEHQADRISAELTGKPRFLSQALEVISDKKITFENAKPEINSELRSPMARLYDKFNNLFSTHPSTPKRVKRLNEMDKVLSIHLT